MAYTVLEMAKVNLSNLVPLPLCFGFFELNFDLGFLTLEDYFCPVAVESSGPKSLGLANSKKGGVLSVVWFETWELPGE